MQAFAVTAEDQSLEGKVPVDQFMMTAAKGPWTMHLPVGSYRLRVVDESGKLIPGCETSLRVDR